MTPNENPPWRTRWDQLNQEPIRRRADGATIRAAWWAFRSVRRARVELRSGGVGARVAAPPRLPWGARGGVYGVLNRLDPTCIERSIVQQAWMHAFAIDRPVVIGVRINADSFQAHAWIEEMADPVDSSQYRVIHRIPAGGPHSNPPSEPA